jgi:riboflavin synthase
MFTGIIETCGRLAVKKPQGSKILLRVQADPSFVKGIRIGDSIAVEGVCLTVIRKHRDTFDFQAIPETLRSTTLGSLTPGRSLLNLEKALKLGDVLGGHMVSGHVDEVGTITGLQDRGENFLLMIRTSKNFLKQLVSKGSVAVDGISLTVQRVTSKGLEIGIIPHTWKVTSLRQKKAGSPVNLEIDMMYKYVQQAVHNMKRMAR